jgi:hypothetical protein
MPLIKSRVRKVTYVRHAYRLSSTMREVLVRYAKFIDESPDYVLNAVIEATLAKDREFLTWQAAAGTATPDVPRDEATVAPVSRRDAASR